MHGVGQTGAGQIARWYQQMNVSAKLIFDVCCGALGRRRKAGFPVVRNLYSTPQARLSNRGWHFGVIAQEPLTIAEAIAMLIA